MTKVYVFSGANYGRYDRGADQLDDGYPVAIADQWSGFGAAGFGGGVDAAVNWGNGKVFFFKDDGYLRYDIAADKVDDGYPLKIADQWSGFDAAGFGSGIDAVVNWGNGKAFFFKGDAYLRYDIAADKVDDGYPQKIVDQWPGFAAAGFTDSVRAAIGWGDGWAYFFRGGQYLGYDVVNDKVGDGYPLDTASNWPGLKDAGLQVPQAVVDLFPAGEIWVPGATVLKATANGPKFIAVPWRGVLHTTEGGTGAGAIASFQQTNFWPHFTADAKAGTITQHLPLTIGARALSDNGVPANAARAIQIEIAGFAAESPNWPPEHIAFLRDLMRQIEDAVPIARKAPRPFLDQAGVNSTPANRMTASEWMGFAGWCGHQHVPGESHWDPGAIDIAGLLAG